MRYFVTGCAGFIGSNLLDRLLQDGHEVTGYDNFATGQPEFLVQAQQSSHFRLQGGDMLDAECLTQAMRGADIVCRLAANADVRFGTQHPRKDLEQNTIATFHVLEAMRANDIRRLACKGSSNPLPKLATTHRVIIGLGAILGHNAPVRWEPGSALVRPVSMARTSLAASRASEADMALSLRNVIRPGRS